MDSVDILGWVALAITQAFWIPNIARILRTRDVAGYSVTAWSLMVVGLIAFLVYFAHRGDVVGVVTNISGISGASFTLACVLRWRRPRPAPAPDAQVPTAGIGDSPASS
jgi:uncharacterized protein with PQ loop repeat